MIYRQLKYQFRNSALLSEIGRAILSTGKFCIGAALYVLLAIIVFFAFGTFFQLFFSIQVAVGIGVFAVIFYIMASIVFLIKGDYI